MKIQWLDQANQAHHDLSTQRSHLLTLIETGGGDEPMFVKLQHLQYIEELIIRTLMFKWNIEALIAYDLRP